MEEAQWGERKKVKTFRLSSLRSLDIFAMPSLSLSIEFVMCSHFGARFSNLCMWNIRLKVIYISHQKKEERSECEMLEVSSGSLEFIY